MPGLKIHKYKIQKLYENNTKLTKQTIKGFDISFTKSEKYSTNTWF